MPKSALIPGKAVFKVKKSLHTMDKLKKAYIQWISQHKMLPKKETFLKTSPSCCLPKELKRLLGTLEMAILPNSDCATRLFLTPTYNNL